MARQSKDAATNKIWGTAQHLEPFVPLVTGANPDGTDFTLPMTSSAGLALEKQRFFFGGSGKMTLAVAGNLRAIISNPAASGRVVYLARLMVTSTGTGWSDLFINPTTGVPTSALRAVNNAVIGAGGSPVGQVRVDTDTTVALSGGINSGVTFGVPANQRVVLDLPPFVLAAGVTLGINNAFAGAADVSISAFWWEV